MTEHRKVVSILHGSRYVEEVEVISPSRDLAARVARLVEARLREMPRTCSPIAHEKIVTSDGVTFETHADTLRLSGDLSSLLEGLTCLCGGRVVGSRGDLRRFCPDGWKITGRPNFCCSQLERLDGNIHAEVYRSGESLFILGLLGPWVGGFRHFAEIPCASLAAVEKYLGCAERLLEEGIEIVDGFILSTDRGGLIVARNVGELEKTLNGILAGR